MADFKLLWYKYLRICVVLVFSSTSCIRTSELLLNVGVKGARGDNSLWQGVPKNCTSWEEIVLVACGGVGCKNFYECLIASDCTDCSEAVVSDVLEPDKTCNTTCEEILRVDTIYGEKVATRVSWYLTSTPFDTILRAREIAKTKPDVIVIDSHQQVYDTVSLDMTGNNIELVHWPSSEIFQNGIPNNLVVMQCICDISFDFNERPDCIFLNHSSTGNKYSKNYVMASLISQLTTDNLFVIVQNNKKSGINLSISELDKFNIKIIVYDTEALKTNEQIHQMLKDATKAMQKNGMQFLLICDEPCVGKILEEANNYDTKIDFNTAMKKLTQWLIFADGTARDVTQKMAGELDNVAFVSLDNQVTDIVNDKTAMLKIMESVMFQLGCEKITAKPRAVSSFGDFMRIYRESIQKHAMEYSVETLLWHENGRRDFTPVGKITGYGDIKLDSSALFPNKNHGFNKRNFVVTLLPWNPFIVRSNDTDNVTYTGFCIDLLKELARTLNFTYTLIEPEDREWGMLDEETGNWSGLVGMLQHRKADLSVAPLSIDYRREEVMDFTYPFYYEYSAALMAKPDPSKRKWRTFFEPFSWKVLVSVIGSLPIASFFLFLFEKFNPFYTKASRDEREGLHKFYDAVWYMYGALLSQGGVHEPASLTGRTMLSFWWIFSIIMVALYSGNLIAFLTVTKEDPPFTTMKGLVENEDYGCGTMDGTLLVTLFRNSSDPTFRAIWNRIENTEGSLKKNISEQIQKVSQEDYVYINDLTSFEFLAANSCEFLIMDEKIYPMHYAVGLPNESPYLDMFTERIMSISEGGLLDIWKRNHWPKTKFCPGSLIAESKVIEMIDIQSAFYLIAVGIFMAIVTLLLELWIHRRRKKKGESESSKPANLANSVNKTCSRVSLTVDHMM